MVILLVGSFFYLRYRVCFSHGKNSEEKVFSIEEGSSNAKIAKKMKESGLISGEIYFYIYVKMNKVSRRIFPGEYIISGNMTIPEIVHIITNPEEKFENVTFPEGFTFRQIADRLDASGLPGEEFLELAKNPVNLKKRYSYLQSDDVLNLEGYLFPDTYFFKKDISAENIAGRLLDTFDEKLDNNLREEIIRQGKTIKEIVTMASILEKEVQTLEDMKIASGIFWKRISVGQRLESDAPLSYILDDNNDSHSGKDLEINSPYNTYRYAGLPPGPICNPGKNAILAAVYPEESPYFFFLTGKIDGTKKVLYARNYEEHLANKRKVGL